MVILEELKNQLNDPDQCLKSLKFEVEHELTDTLRLLIIQHIIEKIKRNEIIELLKDNQIQDLTIEEKIGVISEANYYCNISEKVIELLKKLELLTTDEYKEIINEFELTADSIRYNINIITQNLELKENPLDVKKLKVCRLIEEFLREEIEKANIYLSDDTSSPIHLKEDKNDNYGFSDLVKLTKS
jgi:hypothetical protein